MKPIFLSMQAFGPFALKQSIEFSKLGHNPLFLINGPTGAGKSTILDAISFALYGESTGKEREPSSMRCDLAEIDTQTEVVFDFTLAGVFYRIVRTPAQELAKKKGIGTTIKGPTALVYRRKTSDDASIELSVSVDDLELLSLKGVKEVNDWVSDITGLSSEQFRQVMVLPQGQFRKLLLADSDQREAIFSQLFQTHIYKQIEEVLKRQSSELRNTRTRFQENVVGLLDSVGLSSVEDLVEQKKLLQPQLKAARLDKEKADQKSIAAVKTLQMGKVTQEKFNKYEKVLAKLRGLKEKGKDIADAKHGVLKAVSARKIQPLKDQAIKIERQLSDETNQSDTIKRAILELEATNESLTQQLLTLQPEWESIDSDKKSLHEWQRIKNLLTGLNEQNDLLKVTGKSLSKLQSDIQAEVSRKENNQKELVRLTDKVKLDSQRLSSLPQLKVDFELFDRLGRLRKQVDEVLEKIGRLDQEKLRVQAQLSENEESIAIEEKSLLKMEISWHQGQAFELAMKLKDNEPCLVCGSLEHPSPANLSKKIFPSKGDVDGARKKLSVGRELLAEKKSVIQSIGFKKTELNHRLVELNSDLGEHQTRSIEWFREQWKSCKDRIEELEALREEQRIIELAIVEISESILPIENRISELNSKREAKQAEYTACSALISEREREVPESTRQPALVDQKIAEIEKKIQAVTEAYQQKQKETQALQQEISSQNTVLENVIDRIGRVTKELEQANGAWRKALLSSEFGSEDEFLASCWSEEYLEQQHALIEKYKIELAELNAQALQFESELNHQSVPDINQLQESLTRAEFDCDEKSKTLNELTSKYEFLTQVFKKLENIRLKVDAIEKEYQVVGTLADVASGQTGSRINLQRFVLGVLLDDVLSEASQRLLIMSKGRFSLLRKLDRSKGNKTSGLELEIEDAYSGARRPANTLSGGESFMAALSLALGLSDVVQSYSGGIKLETLFIDEGFGSLDMESLDLAIQTLIDLRKSGRTIGIISHVSELKEQMTQRIDVTPSDLGSQINVVSG
jgi:exonuclease SbcC